jgi:hypothetical protein
MFVLRKIHNIERKYTCFCGKQLVKGICEEHGPDIKPSLYTIHAQFENTESKKEAPINISVTETQFLNLFPKKYLDRYFINHEEFEIEITQFGANDSMETVVSSFFDQIEFDTFFDFNRLRCVQITDSGVTLHFLFNYEFLLDNKFSIKFSIIALRSVSDYIIWRMKKFQAKPENVIASLLGLRKKVYDENGEVYQISEVDWDFNEEFPNSIQVLASDGSTGYKPGDLYHKQENIQLSTKVENKIQKALRNFTQQFTNSIKQYLIAHSCLANIQKINQTNLLVYDRFIGKNIRNTVDLSVYQDDLE